MAFGRDLLMRFVNRNPWIRKGAKSLMRFWWGIRFAVSDLFIKTDDKTIVFKVYQGRQYTCSPRAIYEEMLKQNRFSDYHFLWIFRNPGEYRWLEDNLNTRVIRFGGREYYKAFAKSKYWIVNSRTRQCLRPGMNHCYVQTWHGTPLKRLGCDIAVEGNNIVSAQEMKNDYRNEGARVSYFLSPSAFYTEKIVSAFDIEAEKRKRCIIEAGYPRNDSLFENTKEEIAAIKRRIGIDDNRKVILYAPTFRDNQHQDNGCSFTMGFNISNFQKRFGNEYVLLFRTHYFITQQFDFERWDGMVYDVTAWPEINDLYKISDILITDYSSVFFDYANLKKPIIFFMYDLKEYQQNIRDFYLDINELPGNVVQTEGELYDEILRVNISEVYDRRYQQFHSTYNYLDGPNSAETVLAKLIPESGREQNSK